MEHLLLHKRLITLVNKELGLLQAVWNSLVSTYTEVCTNVLMSGKHSLDPCRLGRFPRLRLSSSQDSYANFSQFLALFWCRLWTLGAT